MANKNTSNKNRKTSQIEKAIYSKDNNDLNLTDHPYCEIPPYFFDKLLARKNVDSTTPTSIFTVETWDGRSVFSVKRTDNH